MNLFLKRNAPVFYMLLAMIVLYAPWMGRGYVNLEYPFSMAARGLSDPRFADQLDAYFGVQANPLGYSFVLALLYKTVGYHDWFWLAKLPSLCGALMIIVSGWILTRDRWHGRRSLFYSWSSLIILHPMIIAYGTAATTDVLPVGLLMLSLAIAYRSADDHIFSKFLAALLFGFAIVVKYNSAYFGLAYLYIAFVGGTQAKKSKTQIYRDISIFVLVPFVLLATYIWWCNARYGVFISNRLADTKPNFLDGASWAFTFGKYLSFLGIFIGFIPILIIANESRTFFQRLKFVAIIFGTLLFGWFVLYLKVMREMNFGYVFGSLNLRLLETFGFLGGICFCLYALKQIGNRDRLSQLLICGLAPYLLLISASRPTQRYLIFAVPVVLLLVVDALKSFSARARDLSVGITALGFAAVSLLGVSYLRAQGNASEDMAVWMEENGVIEQSAPGAIFPHARQHFYGLAQSEVKYDVTATSLDGEKLIKERILHREPMNVLGKITRVYVLYELPKKP